jgi:8-oxo-dGTP diphosphatase
MKGDNGALCGMIRVVAGLIERDGSILVCQRRRDDRFPLKWEFPGGKVEPGETLQGALTRELLEELGVQAQIGRELHRADYRYAGRTDFFTIAFFSASIGEQQEKNLVFESVAWTKPENLPSYDFLEANHELIALLANGTLHV